MILRPSRRGFSLIELLVVCGIMVVVTSLILASNSQYGGRVLLQSFVYDVALSIRQAQVYGIAVQRAGIGASATFGTGYGIHLDTTTLDNAKQYILFADINSNGIYDVGEEVPPSPFKINRNYFISRLCVPAGLDVSTCTQVQTLDIVFVRPEPDARISWKDLDSTGTQHICIPQNCLLAQPNARIVLQSPHGDSMSISVHASGQIAVDQKPLVGQ